MTAWHFEYLRGLIDASAMRMTKQASKMARFFFVRTSGPESWDRLKESSE